MKEYDPEVAPIPEDWLSLDEHERVLIVEDHHRSAGIKLPNANVHAAIHTIVENQIAEQYDPTVRAMARLRKEGLSRHDALHAIGSVAAELFFDVLNTKYQGNANAVQAEYSAAVERLSAKIWRKTYGVSGRGG